MRKLFTICSTFFQTFIVLYVNYTTQKTFYENKNDMFVYVFSKVFVGGPEDLKILEGWWNHLERLEDDMRHVPAARKMWEFFWWPQTRWCREVFVRLRQDDFKKVSDDLYKKVLYMHSSLMATTPCELGGGVLRKKENATPSKRIGHLGRWHRLITSSLLSDFERSPVETTNESDAERQKKVPEAVFELGDWANTLGKDYDSLSQPANWPTLTHLHRQWCFLSFASFIELDGNWDRHLRTWRSAFAVEGQLLHNVKKDIPGSRFYLVYKSSILITI